MNYKEYLRSIRVKNMKKNKKAGRLSNIIRSLSSVVSDNINTIEGF